MELIKVSNLTKSYGSDKKTHVVLDKVSFSVKQGEFVGFIGESGYGKSTLMHLLGGLDKATSGDIVIEEENIAKFDVDEATEYRRKNIGILYQFYNLIPSLTVEQNITFPALLEGDILDVKYYAEIVNYLALNTMQNRYPKELTGFEQQCVALARALMVKPKFILADEPTGNLSMKEQEIFLNVLKKVQAKFNQTIIIFSSTKKAFVYCDEVYRLVDGKLESRVKE